jgi:Restriction endonuclease
MLLSLFAELGFDAERSVRAEDGVDFFAVDPTPIRGGRIYVRGMLASDGLPIQGDDVRALIDTARYDPVAKAVLVTIGEFSDEAREAARDNPVDLVDGDVLAGLVRKHLPQAFATRTV